MDTLLRKISTPVFFFTAIFLISYNYTFAQDSLALDSSGEVALSHEPLDTTEDHTTHEAAAHDQHTALNIGERLFNGLAGSGTQPVNCASCHNTREIDTLNWSPSAVEIAISTKTLDSTAYANLLLKPIGKRLSVAHEGIELSGEEIVQIRDFLTETEQNGLEPKKLDISRLLIFIFLVLLAGVAVADLFWFKTLKFKAIPIMVFLLASGFGTKMIVIDAIALGRSENYAPIQPIKFSHVVHAGENEIDCQYCHHTAEISKSAGIPSVDVCLNCHTLVRDATRSGKFEIKKIHAAMDSGHAIEWVRVHRLPDFVYFNHSQHVGVGKLECQECHGPVEEMHLLKQENDLSMGWCLDCHRSRKVNFSESEYYKMTFKEFHQSLEQNLVDSILVEDIGGTDCMKCHY